MFRVNHKSNMDIFMPMMVGGMRRVDNFGRCFGWMSIIVNDTMISSMMRDLWYDIP
jgi:hypothetical protein